MNADAASKAAKRMRESRQRRRNGLRACRIAYPSALPLALADAGLLPAWSCEDPDAVRAAIEAALRAMVVSAGYSATGSGDDGV